MAGDGSSMGTVACDGSGHSQSMVKGDLLGDKCNMACRKQQKREKLEKVAKEPRRGPSASHPLTGQDLLSGNHGRVVSLYSRSTTQRAAGAIH